MNAPSRGGYANDDLSSTHEGVPTTVSVPPWIKPGAPTVQALAMAMPHLPPVMTSPLVQPLLPVNGQYGPPIGGMTAVAPGMPSQTVNPPALSQRAPTGASGPSAVPRVTSNGIAKYYP